MKISIKIITLICILFLLTGCCEQGTLKQYTINFSNGSSQIVCAYYVQRSLNENNYDFYWKDGSAVASFPSSVTFNSDVVNACPSK